MVIHEQIRYLHSNHCVHSNVIKTEAEHVIYFLLQWQKNNFFAQYVWGSFPSDFCLTKILLYFGTEFWYLAPTSFINTKTKKTVFKDLTPYNLVDRYQTTRHPRTPPPPNYWNFIPGTLYACLTHFGNWYVLEQTHLLTFQQDLWTGPEIV
jgi:hypothetical protein